MADLPDVRERFSAADPRRTFQARTPQSTNRGAVSATPQTSWGVGDTSSILANVMEPYIKRKQQESFVKGFVEQAKAGADAQVISPDNPASTLFGPSHYEQGASAFQAQAIVNQWATDTLADMDNIKKLSDVDFQKWIGTQFEQYGNTGNRWADEMITSSMLKAVPGITQQRSEARFAWQQQVASTEYRNMVGTAFKTFNEYMSRRYQEPGIYTETDVDRQQVATLLGQVGQKAPGQMDEAFERDLLQMLQLDVEQGNFHAYNTLTSQGLLDVIPADKKKALQASYETNGRRAQGDMLLQSEDLRFKYATIETRIERASSEFWTPMAGDEHKISPAEVQAGIMEINEELARRTGVQGQNFFSANDILSKGGSVIRGMAQAAEAAKRRDANLQDTVKQKELEARLDAQVATLAWETGGAREAILGGAKESSFDLLAANDVATGNWSRLSLNYRKDPRVWESAKRTLLAPIRASEGVGYTNALDQSLTMFNAMRQENQAMAMDYYQEHYARLEQVDRAIKGGQLKEAAWNAVYKQENLGEMRAWARADQRRNTEKQVKEWAEKNLDGSLLNYVGLGSMPMNDSGKAAFQSAAMRRLAVYQDSTLSIENQISGILPQLVQSGAFQNYGRFGWEAAVGTRPLHIAVGVPQETMTSALEAMIDGGLKRRDPRGGAKGNSYEIIHRDDGTNASIVVIQNFDDGSEAFLELNQNQLKAGAQAYIKAIADRKDTVSNVIRGVPGVTNEDRRKVFRESMEANVGVGNRIR